MKLFEPVVFQRKYVGQKTINNVNEMFEMYKIKGPVCVLASLFQDRNRIVKTI